MVIRSLLVLAAIAALGACAEKEPPASEAQVDARAILVRASLDFRGIRPTAAEIDAVLQDPTSLDATVDGFADDPRFGDRVKSLFADALRTRRDFYRFDASAYGIDYDRDPIFQAAIAEETLDIIAHVAVTDAPFTEILTADYTIVDPILLEAWPLEEVSPRPVDLPEGRTMARYTDGRPSAGILSTTSLWWRHESTLDNANRGRSNALSRALLCEDYLDRPIDFPSDVDLTDLEAVQNAVQTNAGCTACHATLDPFASHLWGFMQQTEDAYAWARYQPANELGWKDVSRAAPAYFGAPTNGRIDTLAARIGRDERFVGCAVKRVYERLLGRSAELADDGQLALHREAFLASGLSLKALYRSVAADPAYRGLETKSAFGGVPAPASLKLAAPDLLASSLSDLSGYHLDVEGREAITVDAGLRAFAGGSDRGAIRTPSLGHALVHRRLAEASARWVADGAAPESRLGALLGEDPTVGPSFETIAALVLEVRSQRLAPDAEDVIALGSIWDTVLVETGSGAEATAALLTALLSDPDLALY